MVIYSGNAKKETVSEGFYPLARELKPEYEFMNPIEVWKQEQKLISNCQEWDRLRDYLDGIAVTPPKRLIGSTNPFVEWLCQNTALSDSSIIKYSSAIGTISREMYERSIIPKPLQNMNAFELDIAISKIVNNDDFIKKNTRGNHMYSNALKQYRYFINSTFEGQVDREENEIFSYINQIKNDITIEKTERTAIIQSRIGQGLFRKSVMNKYNSTCIITGINHPKLLVASHIKPWAVCTNTERLDENNGLLLSATYDRLFDCGLITFDKTERINVSSCLGIENAKRLHLEKGMRFDLHVSGNMKEYLEYHNDVLFVK